MTPFPKALKRGIAWLLFVIGGLSFWVGGRAISEFGKVDRIISEMLGLGIAGACLALGFVLKTAAEPDKVEEDPNSEPKNTSARK